MPKMNMLDHQKLLLKNSSHDTKMFEKELTKSMRWLEPNDVRKLYLWLKNNYWNTHKNIIEAVFENYEAA